MARARRAKPEMTASTRSWDAVSEGSDDVGFTEEEEREELGDAYITSRTRLRHESPEEDEASDQATPLRSRRPHANGDKESGRRMVQSNIEPQLVMPTSFDGSPPKQKLRASTPHLRMNQRSLTSDAGVLKAAREDLIEKKEKTRTRTPRLRMNDRSMTSDAGRLRGPKDRENEQGRPRRSREEEFDEKVDDSSDLNWPVMLWEKLLRPIVYYIGSIAAIAARQAKPTLGVALLLWLVLGLGRNFLLYTVDQALSPLCRIPGVSWLGPSFCPQQPVTELPGNAEFDKLMDAQSQFNDVLITTAGGHSLPLDMKRSEAGMRDLKHVVEYSNLPSRNELVFEFAGFIETARQASQDLGKFNSRIGRAVDHILSTNRWTLQVVEDVRAADEAGGSIARWVSNNLDPFAPFRPVPMTRDVLLDQYLRHTSAVEEEMIRLISEAHALLNVLDNLDGRLDIIASIATRDGIKAQDNKEELFAMLWTKIGGNRASVAKVERQLQLLKDVGAYKRLAWAHVTGTIVKLQAIRDNLEDLRERVAMPEVLGDKVPLEVHVQNINLGIERLEAQRDASRRVEAESYQRVLDRAEGQMPAIGDREL